MQARRGPLGGRSECNVNTQPGCTSYNTFGGTIYFAVDCTWVSSIDIFFWIVLLLLSNAGPSWSPGWSIWVWRQHPARVHLFEWYDKHHQWAHHQWYHQKWGCTGPRTPVQGPQRRWGQGTRYQTRDPHQTHCGRQGKPGKKCRGIG